MSELIVGIDLGTTHSLIGTLQDGRAVLLADESEAVLLPSVVGTGDAGEVLVGRPARNRRLVDPAGTVVNVKRQMGTNARFTVAGCDMAPPEISALILSSLLDRAERRLGARPTRAVITVPAFFDDRQRQATRDAGEIAGLTVERLVNEPTAAAVSYQTGGEETVLVYDFGGGTFDVSILERNEGLLEVRTSRGDTQLGGADIDRALVVHILERLGDARKTVEAEPRAMTRLYEAVERAKIALADREEVRVFEPFLAGRGDDSIHLDEPLDRTTLDAVAAPFLERTLACIDRALDDAGLDAEEIDRILLVGGSSRMTCVAKRVAEHLGRPVIVDEQADRVVALGASLLAGRAAGLDVEEVLVDITPHTLSAGVEDSSLPNGLFEGADDDLVAAPVIPRDTVVPVERTETYYTSIENQPGVMIPIVQGEERLARGNTPLGVVRIDDLPPGPENSPVEVAFRLDLSGVLHVTAVHVPSGKSARVTIADSPSQLSEQRRRAAREQIAALREHRPAPDNGASDTELSLAKAMATRAERALERAAPDADPEATARARATRDALIDGIETRAADLADRTDALSDALLDLL